MVIFLVSKSDHVIFPLRISQLLYGNKSDYSGGFINWSLRSHQSYHFSCLPTTLRTMVQTSLTYVLMLHDFFLTPVPVSHNIFSVQDNFVFFFVWPIWKSSTHPSNFSSNINSFTKPTLISLGWVQCCHIFLLSMCHTTIIILPDFFTHQTTWL